MKHSRFAYVSAIIIIVLMITFSQAVIQVTLLQEMVTRNTATLLNMQELRTQRILRSALLLAAPDPMNKAINPLQVDPAKQLDADLTFTQQSQAALIGAGSSISSQISALQPEYQAMHDASALVLADHKKNDRMLLVKQLAPVFQHEQKYLTGIYQAFTSLTVQADELVNRIRWLEIGLYLLSLVVVGYEVFGVVVPVNRDQRAEIDALRSQIGLLQEAMRAKRSSTNET